LLKPPPGHPPSVPHLLFSLLSDALLLSLVLTKVVYTPLLVAVVLLPLNSGLSSAVSSVIPVSLLLLDLILLLPGLLVRLALSLLL
jgi:hypothetical protein